MAFVAVNKDNSEVLYDFKPVRERNFNEFWVAQYLIREGTVNIKPQEIEVPKGTIEKLIGKKLTWEDEPVELKEKQTNQGDVQMGAKECSKRGCENIMCDDYIENIGYICHECKTELKNINPKSEEEVVNFMHTKKEINETFDLEKMFRKEKN